TPESLIRAMPERFAVWRRTSSTASSAVLACSAMRIASTTMVTTMTAATRITTMPRANPTCHAVDDASTASMCGDNKASTRGCPDSGGAPRRPRAPTVPFGLLTDAARRECLDRAPGRRIEDPLETPDAGVGERPAQVAVEQVALVAATSTGAAGDVRVDDSHRREPPGLDVVPVRDQRVERPALSTEAEHVRLLVARCADRMHDHRVTGVRLEDRRRRVAASCGRAEDGGCTLFVRQCRSGVVDRRRPVHVVRVRHLVLPDPLILVAQEHREVTVGRLA